MVNLFYSILWLLLILKLSVIIVIDLWILAFSRLIWLLKLKTLLAALIQYEQWCYLQLVTFKCEIHFVVLLICVLININMTIFVIFLLLYIKHVIVLLISSEFLIILFRVFNLFFAFCKSFLFLNRLNHFLVLSIFSNILLFF